jgi:hypothetical protein
VVQKYLVGAAMAALLCGTAAQATTIDFEGGAPGTLIDTTYSGLGATFSNAYFQQCGGGCPAPALGIFASTVDTLGSFDVGFASLQSKVSFINVSFSSVTATAYDTFGNAISSVSDTQGFPITGAVDVLTGPGISYVTFSGGGGSFGIDDLSFGVPEPATWALMLVGFGGLGGALRTRRRTAAVTLA